MPGTAKRMANTGYTYRALTLFSFGSNKCHIHWLYVSITNYIAGVIIYKEMSGDTVSSKSLKNKQTVCNVHMLHTYLW